MHTTARARTSRLLTALGMAGALLSMATPGFAAVTPATLTLSSTQGPNTGGNMITASVPAGSTQFFPGVDVEFQVAASASTACTPLYAAPVSPTSSAGGIIDVPFAMVVSATRLAINVHKPIRVPPRSTTTRVPSRSESAPQTSDPTPMHRKLSRAAVEMPVRDQPVSADIG